MRLSVPMWSPPSPHQTRGERAGERGSQSSRSRCARGAWWRPLTHLFCGWLIVAGLTAVIPWRLTAAETPENPPKPAPEKAADKPADKPTADAAKAKPAKEESEEKKTDTKHSITAQGHKIDYTARAGFLTLKDRENKPTADLFYIAYTQDGNTNLAHRPVTFSFNGGPGSSAVWMELGLLGPRRVVLEKDGGPVPPPYRLQDNEFTLLGDTDLVFIDPVGTGFSRATKADDARRFYGVQEDVASVADFIRLYTTRNARWPSPKFVIGESYGTTRAAALSGELHDRHRMNLNGIMLVSTVLNFQTLAQGRGNDLGFVLYLPTYCAVAWYHKKLPDEWQRKPLAEVLAAVEAFAEGDYQMALLQGDGLPPEKRRKVVEQTARFTGLSVDLVDRLDLRIPLSRFNIELLRKEDEVIGRFDGRYRGRVRDRAASNAPYDPSAEAVFSAFASTFNHYVRHELKYENDQPYELLASVGPWDWGANNSFLNVGETLADNLTRQPFLLVHVSSGFFDQATPYFATRYTFNHLGLDPVLAKNVTLDYYTAGHMMYLNEPDLQKQHQDLARFIRRACGPNRQP